ncbi:hypothetical protein KC324_g11643, partial [Hortaea werneckii]
MRLPPLSVITTWPVPNYTHPQTHGRALLITNLLLITLVLLAVLGRLYARLIIKRWYGADDSMIVLACLATIGMNTVVILANERYGWNRHIYDIPPQMIASAGKIAFVAKLAFVFAATPVEAYWQYPPNPDAHCLDEGKVMLGGGVINCVSDLLTTVLPIPIVMRLQMPLKQRIGVCVLLCLGFIVTIAGVIRTYFIWKSLIDSWDQTWFAYPLWIAAAVEIDLAVMEFEQQHSRGGGTTPGSRVAGGVERTYPQPGTDDDPIEVLGDIGGREFRHSEIVLDDPAASSSSSNHRCGTPSLQIMKQQSVEQEVLHIRKSVPGAFTCLRGDWTSMSADGSSAAADISFTRLGNHNRHGESSSQAESRSRSSGKRSGETQRWSRGEIGSSHSRDIGSSHSHSHSHGTPSSRASTEGDSRRRYGHMSKKSGGGFLLDSFSPNGHARRSEGEEREQERERQWDRHGKRKAQDGHGSHLQVEKRRHGQNRFSTGSSYGAGGSPLSREVSMSTQDNDRTNAPRSASGSQHARSASMDPAQLVQMALELSESRRRQTSAPMHWPMGSPRDSRRVSALASGHHERPRSPGRPRASLGARDVSNNASAAAQPRQSIATEPASDQPASEIVPDHFSSATLARAEKARKYFELASEHRRLLESLPPLKADAEAPGNYTFVSTSSPHTPHPQIER